MLQNHYPCTRRVSCDTAGRCVCVNSVVANALLILWTGTGACGPCSCCAA
jgi:hypothetical protein